VISIDSAGRTSAESGDVVVFKQHLDAAGNAAPTSDKPSTLQLDDHSMDGRGRHMKEALHVGFGGGTIVQQRVGMDEGEVLALLVCEFWHEGIDKTAMD
jgi:hypothetical protein